MRLRLTLAAEFDLEHIRDTIISENPAAAEKVQRAIAKAIELLQSFPYLGRPGALKETREKVVKSLPYIVVYRVREEELIILRIFHGAQNRP